MSDYFEIGKIVNTQGLKGDLRVMACTDDPKRFEQLESVYVDNQKTVHSYTIEKVWYHKKFVILKFKEISTINEAELLKNSIIKIPTALALPLEENEYYIRDLYGLQVRTDLGENLGVIKDIIFTGSNDVYIIDDPTQKDKKQLLIPAIKDCINKVDLNEKVMIVHLLEGLRDE